GLGRVIGFIENTQMSLASSRGGNVCSRERIRNLVFQGGSVKGLAYLGIYKILLQHPEKIPIKDIRRVGGASVGSITAVLFGVDYALDRMEAIMSGLDIISFLDGEAQAVFLALKQAYAAEEGAINIATGVINTFKGLIENIIPPILKSAGGQAVGLLKRFIPAKLVDYFPSMMRGVAPLILAAISPRTRTGLTSIPAELSESGGIFTGIAAREWVDDIIKDQIGIVNATFRDLHDSREQLKKEKGIDIKDIYIVALNISKGRLEIFSYDNEDTRDVIIADAVRASMSIPIVFKPYQIRCKDAGKIRLLSDDYYVDGGVANNYPVDLFDQHRYLSSAEDGSTDHSKVFNRETLGFRLVTREYKDRYEGSVAPVSTDIGNPLELFKQIISLFLGDHLENTHVKKDDMKRTVYIDIRDVGMLDFDLRPEQKNSLIESGELALYDFLTKYGTVEEIGFNNQMLVCLLKHGVYFKEIETFSNPQGTIETINLRNLSFARLTPQAILNIVLGLYELEIDKQKICKLLRYLISIGLDINLLNQEEQSALSLAISTPMGLQSNEVTFDFATSRSLGIIDILFEIKANTKYQDSRGNTLLDKALQNPDKKLAFSVIRTLLKKGLFKCNNPSKIYDFIKENLAVARDRKCLEETIRKFLLFHVKKYLPQENVEIPFKLFPNDLLGRITKHMDERTQISNEIFNLLKNFHDKGEDRASQTALPRILALTDGVDAAQNLDQEEITAVQNLVLQSANICSSIAYVGALQVMHTERTINNINLTKINCIVGISGGALIAGFIGCGFAVDALEPIFIGLKTEHLLGVGTDIYNKVKAQYKDATQLMDAINTFFPSKFLQGKWRSLLGGMSTLLLPNVVQQAIAIGTTFSDNSGIASIDSLREWLIEQIKRKTGNGLITFEELSKQENTKELRIVALDIMKNCT
ncbi:MAG: patatin-like phospholipase family protein, partial [Candidatus Omnitrophica bacterium]|nr:patatin-like phospholipase family protein [Candidatus Omnitrophota bacterium]